MIRIGPDRYSKASKFSGGELHVVVDPVGFNSSGSKDVVARLQSSDDVMELFMVLETLHRRYDNPLNVIIPYFPYARQDRVTEASCAFSLKVFCNLLNSQLKPYDRVTTYDPHSDVVPALCDRLEIVTTLSILQSYGSIKNYDIHAFVAPDAGAYKKTMKIGAHYDKPVIVATKSRDVMTGELGEPQVHGTVPERVLILDDICDGGRTFTALAKVLREAGARWVGLYVTHGIFSKGLEVFDGLIDKIITTDTFLSPHHNKPSDILSVKKIIN